MSKYTTFLSLFIVSVIAVTFFMFFYMQGIFGIISHVDELENAAPNPLQIFSTIFSPALIISLLILIVSGLAYRIMGIVFVAKNKTVTDGEKALWIVGFVLMGFVTGIVFLIMAKGRKYVA